MQRAPEPGSAYIGTALFHWARFGHPPELHGSDVEVWGSYCVGTSIPSSLADIRMSASRCFSCEGMQHASARTVEWRMRCSTRSRDTTRQLCSEHFSLCFVVGTWGVYDRSRYRLTSSRQGLQDNKADPIPKLNCSKLEKCSLFFDRHCRG